MSIRLQPAARVIEILGGIDATAGIVGRHRTSVNRWLLPRPGGTGGVIPMRVVPRLLKASAKLKPEDFIPVAASAE